MKRRRSFGRRRNPLQGGDGRFPVVGDERQALAKASRFDSFRRNRRRFAQEAPSIRRRGPPRRFGKRATFPRRRFGKYCRETRRKNRRFSKFPPFRGRATRRRPFFYDRRRKRRTVCGKPSNNIRFRKDRARPAKIRARSDNPPSNLASSFANPKNRTARSRRKGGRSRRRGRRPAARQARIRR